MYFYIANFSNETEDSSEIFSLLSNFSRYIKGISHFFIKKPQQSAALFDDEEDGLFAKPKER